LIHFNDGSTERFAFSGYEELRRANGGMHKEDAPITAKCSRIWPN